MIEESDYEPLEWHSNSMDEDEGDENSLIPFPITGIQTIILIVIVAASSKKENESNE